MTNTIDPNSFPTSTPQTATSGSNTLDKDAFLKLLVAQLKYQNPMNPTDPTAFMAQTAQFTMIEKLDAMQTQYKTMISANNASMASSMLGRTISTYMNSHTITGKVTKVDFDVDGPVLYTDTEPNTKIPLTAVQEVK